MTSSGSLPLLSSDKVIKALKRSGFIYAPKRGKGSHTALVKEDENGKKRLVIIPKNRVIPRGTLLSILNQAGMSKDEFLSFLR